MTQIFTAKTVQDAKALAARTFGTEEDKIRFEILEEPKRGLLGIFKGGEAKVKATYIEISVQEEIPAEIPETILKEETVLEIPEEVPEEMIEEIAEEIPAEDLSTPVEDSVEIVTENIENLNSMEEIAQTIPETVSEIPEEVPEEMIEEILPEESPEEISETNSEISENSEESGSILELISGEASEESLQKIERAKNYLTSVLSAMNIQATLHVKAGAESVLINIETKNSGAVIGKHGDTLDALQYLTFMSANQGAKEYYRIILDTADYRERRRKTLEELAAKIAANVLRTDRPRTLEPMNPYERRIIHSVIADTAGVISRSVGEEPYRKIMILPENHSERSGRRNASDRHNRHGHHRNSRQIPARSSGSGYRSRSRSDRREEMPSSRISMDSMKTDFEKGYRRPRPEDELNTGLYGKLNFD
ncbi:MAG: Jag N-terminal domain-containing protein [Oscillospiraceae bacterium]|nr:Jag N-terminal domain-containing protein [Oscillospiraceae bacterium]